MQWNALAHHINSTSSWAYFLATRGWGVHAVLVCISCVRHVRSTLPSLFDTPNIPQLLEWFPLDPARGRSKMVLRHMGVQSSLDLTKKSIFWSLGFLSTPCWGCQKHDVRSRSSPRSVLDSCGPVPWAHVHEGGVSPECVAKGSPLWGGSGGWAVQSSWVVQSCSGCLADVSDKRIDSD